MILFLCACPVFYGIVLGHMVLPFIIIRCFFVCSPWISWVSELLLQPSSIIIAVIALTDVKPFEQNKRMKIKWFVYCLPLFDFHTVREGWHTTTTSIGWYGAPYDMNSSFKVCWLLVCRPSLKPADAGKRFMSMQTQRDKMNTRARSIEQIIQVH
jgi:hypothetical protein